MKDLFDFVRNDRSRLVIRFVAVIAIFAVLLDNPPSTAEPLEQSIIVLCTLLGNFFLFHLIGIIAILGIVGNILRVVFRSKAYNRDLLIPLVQFGAMIVAVALTFLHPGIARLSGVLGLVIFIVLDVIVQFFRTAKKVNTPNSNT